MRQPGTGKTAFSVIVFMTWLIVGALNVAFAFKTGEGVNVISFLCCWVTLMVCLYVEMVRL